MLTKSQARLFFVLGTVIFSGVFLFLTVDTVKKVPKQTNQDKLTPEVLRGKEIWDKNNCMGCHTLLGEGAYYAPELTKTVERRGKEWLKVFLKDPQAMYPGDRKMVQYNFTDAQINDIIAFFDWIGKMDLNGFPAKHDLASEAGAAGTSSSNINDASAVAQPEKFKQLCVACHSLGNVGGTVGPALDTVGRKYDVAYLHKWIKDPALVKPGTKMPKMPLTEEEITQLSEFLSAKK